MIQIDFKKCYFQFLANPNVKTEASASDTTYALARTGSAGLIVGIEPVRPTAKMAGSAQCRTTYASADRAFTEQDVTKSRFDFSYCQQIFFWQNILESTVEAA